MDAPDVRFREPSVWRNPAFNAPGQPVVGVCWFEVRAYCAWLSAECQRAGDKVMYRLPTEIEWEAAAGGPGEVGRTFPWGEAWNATRCNVPETRIKGTTPVGVFPDGDTPEGIGDLAGNIFEWTSTLYRPLINDLNDGREDPELVSDEKGDPLARVVRGGSWDFNAVDARVACRDYGVPGDRNSGLGFRLVRVSHS